LVKADKFPQPRTIVGTTNKKLFVRSEILAYFEEIQSQSETKKVPEQPTLVAARIKKTLAEKKKVRGGFVARGA